jgi:hypothetical protein
VNTSRQERVARLLHDHGPLAPPELRARIAAERARANDGSRRAWYSRLPLAPVAGLAAALAALAVVLPQLLGGDPDALDAHALGSRGPEAPAPAASTAGMLAAGLEGVGFPDWSREFGWRAAGRRSDELDGRRTETVFYRHEGHTIAYTIVSGQPLEPPPGGQTHRRAGVEMQLLSDDHGHDIVVFERGGKTCVLSGHVLHRSTLLELASWRGRGQVPF